MTDIRSRLADAIAEALESNPSVDLAVPFARGRVGLRAADRLMALPGIAIVELPDVQKISAEHIGYGTGNKDCDCCPGWVVDYDTDITYGIDEARGLAAALLAAAVQAQEEQS